MRYLRHETLITELLVVDERPDHAIVDAQAPLSQLGDQTTQGEVALPAALQKLVPILANQLLRPMASHLAGRHATGLAISVDPLDRRADRHFEASRSPTTRQSLVSTASITRSRRSIE